MQNLIQPSAFKCDQKRYGQGCCPESGNFSEMMMPKIRQNKGKERNGKQNAGKRYAAPERKVFTDVCMSRTVTAVSRIMGRCSVVCIVMGAVFIYLPGRLNARRFGVFLLSGCQTMCAKNGEDNNTKQYLEKSRLLYYNFHVDLAPLSSSNNSKWIASATMVKPALTGDFGWIDSGNAATFFFQFTDCTLSKSA